jgi:hypothetical protein
MVPIPLTGLSCHIFGSWFPMSNDIAFQKRLTMRWLFVDIRWLIVLKLSFDIYLINPISAEILITKMVIRQGLTSHQQIYPTPNARNKPDQQSRPGLAMTDVDLVFNLWIYYWLTWFFIKFGNPNIKESAINSKSPTNQNHRIILDYTMT